MNWIRTVTNWTAFPSQKKLEIGKQSHLFWAFWKQEDLKRPETKAGKIKVRFLVLQSA